MKSFSLDASMFSRNAFDLSSGKLALIAKRPIDTRFVICELVIKEVKKNWIKQAGETLDIINKKLSQPSVSRFHDLKLIPIPSRQELAALVDGEIATFIKRSRVEVIPVATEALEAAVSLYESGQPPFGREKKQDEFKDALILKSLESWARFNKCKVMVASVDGDWKSFCERSEHLEYVDDLAIALENAQSELVATKKMIDVFLNAIRAGEQFDGWDDLAEEVKDGVEDIDPIIEASAPCDVEWWQFDLTAQQPRPARANNELLYRVLSADEGKITIDLQLSIKCAIGVTFDFSTYDPIDGDHVHLNSRGVAMDAYTRATCIVELEVDDGKVLNVLGFEAPRFEQLLADFGDLSPYDEDETYEE